MIMYFDLFLFRNNLLMFRHSFSVESSSFITDCMFLLCVLSFKDFKALDNVVSSAYLMKANI